jgi:hypothetical protein
VTARCVPVHPPHGAKQSPHGAKQSPHGVDSRQKIRPTERIFFRKMLQPLDIGGDKILSQRCKHQKGFKSEKQKQHHACWVTLVDLKPKPKPEV